MNLLTALKICITICENRDKEKPGAGLTNKGEHITYKEVAEELRKLKEWCYPLETKRLIVKGVRCAFCKHGTAANKTRSGFICDLDNQCKPRDHYCGFAVDKEADDKE